MSAPVMARFGRYRVDGRVAYGRLEGDAFERWSAAPWLDGRVAGPRDSLARVSALPPCEPTKIVCVGLNYRAHIAESASVVPGAAPAAEPLLFLKPPSAVIASGEAIRYPAGVTRLDPEAEMALVMGRRACRVAERTALEHVAGVTALNDVSARNYQRSDGQWARAKGFDTFAPLGPFVATGLDPGSLAVECRVNGALRQSARTSDLLFSPAFLVAFISHIMTLEPGDVIATGTPAGVAAIAVGDRVEVEVEGVGILFNTVESVE